MKKLSFVLSLALLLFATSLLAQKLIVVNGGITRLSGPPSTDYANVAIYDISDDSYTSFDTIYTNSVQDAMIEANQFLYVAAQDSVVKYDLATRKRLAATAFESTSTVKMAIYNDKLLVGNWYGSTSNNFRIFDKNTLVFEDSIPEISRAATDFVVIGDTAYIAQNLTGGSWQDTLGHMAVVDLTTMTWVRNDTIHANGEEFGRMTVVNSDQIYVLSSASNVTAHYNTQNNQSTITTNTGIDLSLRTYGASIYEKDDTWYFPCSNSNICSYNLINGTVVNDSIVNALGTANAFALTMDTLNNYFYTSKIHYGNSTADRGVIYNIAGDSIGSFPTGFYPEVLVMYYDHLSSSNKTANPTSSFKVYPNPARHYLNLDFVDIRQRQLIISNLSGQRIFNTQLNSRQTTLDIKNLSTGFYQVTIVDESGKKEAQKFVKY